jgi:hypothetical protein
MPSVDDYVIDTLMRDLVGHDRRPASFLVYLWLAAEQARRQGGIEISYQELAESIGISKSSAQSAVRWLLKRRLLGASRQSVTATPRYVVRTPWREHAQRLEGRR